MTRAEFIYLLPYLGSLLLCVALLAVIRYNRNANGSAALFYYMLGQSLYVFGFIFELMSAELQGKLFWENAQWMASCLPVVAFPVFAAGYGGYRFKNQRNLFLASLAVPILFAGFVATNSLHDLTYLNKKLASSGPFMVLEYEYSPILIGFSIYLIFIVALSCIVLFTQVKRPQNLYRPQTWLVIIGAMIPLAGPILSVVNIQPHRSASLIAITIGSLVLARGVYRFRIFEVEPIARE